eukprot:Partr_v1_DN27315_c1_g1_i3_m46233 putative trehalase
MMSMMFISSCLAFLVRSFIIVCAVFNTHFRSGSDLEPADLREPPKPIQKLPLDFRAWADYLQKTWSLLARKTIVTCEGCQSIVGVKHPFIVPGGRFNEHYYWDTYWINKGLLASGLYSIVVDSLENFYGFIDSLGFVPNGNRVYYTRRSQPPVLVQMVRDAFVSRHDFALLERALPYLLKEYRFWMSRRVHYLSDVDSLNIYSSDLMQPRPESYLEDLQLAARLKDPSLAGSLYSNIIAGAETGWDFSSRWLKDSSADLLDIQTNNVVPVDLNSLMFMNEVTLSWIVRLLDCHNSGKPVADCLVSLPYSAFSEVVEFDASKWWDTAKHADKKLDADFFKHAAIRRRKLIHQYFWDDDMATWLDYDITSASKRRHLQVGGKPPVAHLSSIYPLWTGAYLQAAGGVSTDMLGRYLNHMNSSLLGNHEGGAPTSLLQSGQQWDFPNAWPPLQWIAVEGLMNIPEGKNRNTAELMAKSLIQRWIDSCFCGWNQTLFADSNLLSAREYMDLQRRHMYNRRSNLPSHVRGRMYEKYDARFPGKSGVGGEYIVQDGFGWTNGVVLDWLDRFNAKNVDARYIIRSTSTCDFTAESNSSSKNVAGTISAVLF